MDFTPGYVLSAPPEHLRLFATVISMRMRNPLILLSGIETGTGLVDRGTELVMTENLRLRIIQVELTEQGEERTFLRPSTGVSGMALRIQPTLVTDTDAMAVPATGMCPYLGDRSAGMQRTIPGDVEMIANIRKASCEMSCP